MWSAEAGDGKNCAVRRPGWRYGVPLLLVVLGIPLVLVVAFVGPSFPILWLVVLVVACDVVVHDLSLLRRMKHS